MISVIMILGSNYNPTALDINQTYLNENTLSVFFVVVVAVWILCMFFVVFIIKTLSLLVEIKTL